MTVATFVISVLALLVGGASLGWNVLNYLLTGQRAKLTVTSMKILGAGRDIEPFLQITVSATGRVPVEVTGWSVAFPDHNHLHSALVEAQYGKLDSVHLGDPLPKTIQAGSSGSFNLPMVAITKSAEHHDLDLNMGHITVYFAARKPLRDKTAIAERLANTSASETPDNDGNGT